jgi:putative FmdB family regulatory protein
MPIYEFRCRRCDARFEAILPLGDRGGSLRCEGCGAGRPERVLSTFATPGGSADTADAAVDCAGGACRGRPFT